MFSQENIDDIPEPNVPNYPAMPEIHVSDEVVFKLMSNLNVNKASGPDHIPSRILKIAAKPLSRCLALLSNRSLTSGTLPQDWCTANITPVFKKGDRFKAANYRHSYASA